MGEPTAARAAGRNAAVRLVAVNLNAYDDISQSCCVTAILADASSGRRVYNGRRSRRIGGPHA